jgi:phosphoenolpyruvate carboxykinase (ATP)
VKEPQPTFSACFAAAFLALHPGVYADMLGAKIEEHGARVWLVNTGWTGGPYGEGSRMKLPYTRAMVRAALDGRLDEVETTTVPLFNLDIPRSVPGVPDSVLNPRDTWADKAAFDAQARKLAEAFQENFEQFADRVPEAVRRSGPSFD